jgi:nanoRNase/pAp phosphatase (c-di-AMP/oligoRNAs hydrolase)
MEYFEGLVETLNKVPEAKFALFLKQDGNVVKGSLRSDPHKGTDVKEIAHMFGGGGHKWASGFSVYGQVVKDNDGKWSVVK